MADKTAAAVRVQLLLIKGAISDLEPHQRAEVLQHADHLRAYLAQGGNEEAAALAQIALALVGAEKAAED